MSNASRDFMSSHTIILRNGNLKNNLGDSVYDKVTKNLVKLEPIHSKIKTTLPNLAIDTFASPSKFA